MSAIEVLCNQAPLQIGNRIWLDPDRDGIQNDGEAPLAKVKVTLCRPDGTKAKNLAGGDATATTDANGYYFIDNLAARTSDSTFDFGVVGLRSGVLPVTR
jgi:hypothetical protein